MKVYHGSNVIVDKPRVLTDGHTKDFGFGFYCTSYEQQAIKWALAKRGKHIVNDYELGDTSSLNVKTFDKMSEEWLDFVGQIQVPDPSDSFLFRKGFGGTFFRRFQK